MVAASRQVIEIRNVGRLPKANDMGMIRKFPRPTKRDGSVKSHTICLVEWPSGRYIWKKTPRMAPRLPTKASDMIADTDVSTRG